MLSAKGKQEARIKGRVRDQIAARWGIERIENFGHKAEGHAIVWKGVWKPFGCLLLHFSTSSGQAFQPCMGCSGWTWRLARGELSVR